MRVIARLDRLAHNVAFIANLMDSRAEFVACDMPQATRLTLHILAAVAEHEREAISQRTKVALAAAKARGTRLGSPDAARFAGAVLPIVDSLTAQGLGLRAYRPRAGPARRQAGAWGELAAATVCAILLRRTDHDRAEGELRRDIPG